MKISSWLLAVGLVLTGVGGGFGPWIWRDSVALQLTAPGLAEFVKFLPEVRTGQIQVERLFFLLPLFLVTLILPLLVMNRGLDLPFILRWGLRLTAIPLALASLSPVWTPAILMSAEFRLQTLLAIISLGLVLFASFFNQLSLKLLIIALTGGNFIAIALSSWQFSLVQASLAETYHEPIWLGWGWQVMVGGMILSTIGGIWTLCLKRKA